MATNGLWSKVGGLFTGAALMFGIIASSLSLEQKAIFVIFILLAAMALYFDHRIRKFEPSKEMGIEEKIFEKLENIEGLFKTKRGKAGFDPVVIGLIIIALIALLYLFFIAPK